MMRDQMRRVIAEYFDTASELLKMLEPRLGGKTPLAAWRSGVLPKEGFLDSQARVHYSFHGVGCSFRASGRVVDVDFDASGRVSGVDLWRLRQFLESAPELYPDLRSREQQELAFRSLVETGELVKSGGHPSPHLFRLCD
jgi:hypothetical protein